MSDPMSEAIAICERVKALALLDNPLNALLPSDAWTVSEAAYATIEADRVRLDFLVDSGAVDPEEFRRVVSARRAMAEADERHALERLADGPDDREPQPDPRQECEAEYRMRRGGCNARR